MQNETNKERARRIEKTREAIVKAHRAILNALDYLTINSGKFTRAPEYAASVALDDAAVLVARALECMGGRAEDLS